MIKEWIKGTYETYPGIVTTMLKIRPRLICNDGFSMSVQASEFHYCDPRLNIPSGEYSTVEIGFPSQAEELLKEYAEDPSDLTGTVYAYVPIEIVETVIENHGGIKVE